MSGFDQNQVFVSASRDEEVEVENVQINHQQYKKNLKDFLRQFQEGQFGYKYRYK